MTDAKVSIRVGQFEFLGEGEQEWVANQLDKILSQADYLINILPEKKKDEAGNGDESPSEISQIAHKTLAAFLMENNATKNQVRKFLVTAIWLQAKLNKRLSTGDITKALRDSNQTKLSNASDNLASNISKGFCEKDGNEFFVTQEGIQSIKA